MGSLTLQQGKGWLWIKLPMISYDSYHMNGEMIQKSHEISAISGWKDYGKFSGNVQNLCQSRGNVHCASCCFVRYKNV